MDEITNKLMQLRDEEYACFQQKLIPTLPKEAIIGVRTPELRKLAKEISKDTSLSEAFLSEIPHTYFEENQLHFFIISEIKDFDKCLEAVERFLPYVDNWATCDQSCPKVFGKNRDKLLAPIKRWLKSEHTYTVRYAIGLLMKLFLDDDFCPEYIDLAISVNSDEYYIHMMISWYIATALAKQWDCAVKVLEEGRLESHTHNKAIQKAKESLRITPEKKIYLSSLSV